MALPGKQSGGGGYLNNVTGVLVGAQYGMKTWPAKKEGGDDYTTISLELEILPAGAEAAVKQFLPAGFLNDDETVEDGVIVADHPVVAVGSDAHKFLSSLVEAGFDESALVEANLNDAGSIVNARVTFKKEIDAEAKAAGRKEKFKTHKGKEVETDVKNLLVKEYHGQVEPAKKGAKSASKSAAPKAAAGKTNGKAKNAEADALIETADKVLVAILKEAGKALDRTSLSAKIVRYATQNKLADESAEHNAIRESLRKLIGSEDFLSRENGWTFAAGDKGQPVEFCE
jgi:hypothetical protein